MKKTNLLLFATLLLFACQKDPSPPANSDASRIEGHWVDLTGTLAPDWQYHFNQGVVTQSFVHYGAVLSSLTYPYAIRSDTVFIGGDIANAPRTWVVYFQCDEVVEVKQVGLLLGHRFWLKKQ